MFEVLPTYQTFFLGAVSGNNSFFLGAVSRVWCETIVTCYIKKGSNNSFAPSPRYIREEQVSDRDLYREHREVTHGQRF